MRTLILILTLITFGISGDKQDDPGFKLYLEAHNNVLISNWNAAIDKCDDLLKKYPKSKYADDAYFWKAYSLKEMKKYNESVLVFEKLLEKYPHTSYRSNSIDNLRGMKSNLNKSYKERVEKMTKPKNNTISYISSGHNNNTASVGTYTYEFPDVHVEPTLFGELEHLEVAGLSDGKYSIFEDYVGVGRTSNLSDEEQLQVAAIRSYYNEKRGASKPGLYKIIQNSDKSEAVKNVALTYYLRVADDYDDIISIYKKNKSERFKITILSNLYRYKDESADDILDFSSDVLNSDESTYELKKAALKTIGKLDNAYDELEDAYKTNNHQTLRNTIISKMAEKYPSESKSFIMGIIKNKKEKDLVRKSAVYYLGRNITSINDLKDLYQSISSDILKKELIYSFYKMGSDESIDYLITLLKNKSTSFVVKKSIIRWLGKSKNPKAGKAIQDLLFE